MLCLVLCRCLLVLVIVLWLLRCFLSWMLIVWLLKRLLVECRVMIILLVGRF